MAKRLFRLFTDFIVNGIVLYGLFLICLFGFYQLSPTILYFNYSSVEPVSRPVNINNGEILMESTLSVTIDGNMYWNDVLRCESANGNFSFFSQQDTSSALVTSGSEKVSQWYYRGEMPDFPATCLMQSTISRRLPFGITKKQTVTSELFTIR